jgi:predicted transcriptional regulator of viral defense system
MIDNCSMSTIVNRVKRAVYRQKSPIVLREQFLSLGSSARVDVALKELCDAGSLRRLGRGVYTKTRISGPQNGRVGIDSPYLIRLALDAMGIAYELDPLILEYEAGETDQVPMRLRVKALNRRKPKLSVGGFKLEYVSNFPTKPGSYKAARSF